MPSDEYVDSPLGPADAKQRKDIEESFVDISRIMGGAKLPHDPATVKIVVGRKGSGKTHMLRRIENESQRAGNEVNFATIAPNFLHGATVYFSGRKLEEGVLLWTTLWQLALNTSILSYFTAESRRPRFKAKRPEIEKIRELYPMIFFETPNPFNPVAALNKIRQRHRTEQSARQLLESIDLDTMEQHLGRLLKEVRPFHFIIDGLDELSWMNPRAWLEIQLGLYHLSFSQSNTRAYLRKVNLTVSLRNYVYSHALRSVHADRMSTGSGLVKLLWDRETARDFLNERLRQISTQNFARANLLIGARPLASWLGFETFKPIRRENPEDVESYLLRHTSCSPRQVITSFNALCSEQNKLGGLQKTVDPQRFGEIVSFYARDNADLMVKTSAEELLSILDYTSKLPDDPSHKYNAMEYFSDAVSIGIKRAIKNCKVEVCGIDEFRNSCYDELHEVLEGVDRTRLIEAIEVTLWRNGIFAYPDGRTRLPQRRWTFAWSEGELGFKSPALVTDQVGFHPTMIDLCNLGVSEHGPVF